MFLPPKQPEPKATDKLTCGQCGRHVPRTNWKRHFDRQHDKMKPFVLKPGEAAVDPDFKPRTGGNYATGSERQSQRLDQSDLSHIGHNDIVEL